MPGLDHFKESPDGGHPGRDVGPARPCIRDSDDGPRKRKKVFE